MTNYSYFALGILAILMVLFKALAWWNKKQILADLEANQTYMQLTPDQQADFKCEIQYSPQESIND